LDQLNFTPSYDNIFHKSYKKNTELEAPIANGIILFSIPGQNIDIYLSQLLDESASDADAVVDELENEFAASSDLESLDSDDSVAPPPVSLLNKLHKNVSLFLNTELNAKEYNLLDVGAFSPNEMDEWLKLVKPENVGSFLQVKYIKPTFNKEGFISDYNNIYISKELSYVREPEYIKKYKKYNYLSTIEKYKENCIKNGLIPVAVLPWKLFKSDIVFVEKEKDYLEPFEKKIQETIEIIKNITRNSTNENEKFDKFAALFPKSAFVKNYLNNKSISAEDIKEFC
jgi:hypothetical protein